MTGSRGTPKGKIDGYDLNSAVRVLLIAAAGGLIPELIEMFKESESGILSVFSSGFLMGILQFINRWRRDNSHDRY